MSPVTKHADFATYRESPGSLCPLSIFQRCPSGKCRALLVPSWLVGARGQRLAGRGSAEGSKGDPHDSGTTGTCVPPQGSPWLRGTYGCLGRVPGMTIQRHGTRGEGLCQPPRGPDPVPRAGCTHRGISPDFAGGEIMTGEACAPTRPTYPRSVSVVAMVLQPSGDTGTVAIALTDRLDSPSHSSARFSVRGTSSRG